MFNYSIAIYKDDDGKSELQMILTTTATLGLIKITSIVRGHPLKSLLIFGEESFNLVVTINDEDDHYMVIYDEPNKTYPISLKVDPIKSFNDACILKDIIPNVKFWRQVWGFLTTKM